MTIKSDFYLSKFIMFWSEISHYFIPKCNHTILENEMEKNDQILPKLVEKMVLLPFEQRKFLNPA